MSEATESTATGRSLVKGMVAGLIAGLIATAAKTLAERIFPPRTHGEPEPADELAGEIGEHLAGHTLSPGAHEAASESIHWAFGAVAGAAYGALAEYYPAATAKDGATFGVALGGLMHDGALPALGLAAEPEDQTLRERASEVSSHLVYGVVAETVRRTVRRML